MNTRLTLLFTFLFLQPNLFSQTNSVLANGDWYKISTSTDGIYQIKFNDFVDLGINTNNLLVDDIKIYGNGAGMLPRLNSDFRFSDLVQNSIKIIDLNNNSLFEQGDYILFYGQSPDEWTYNDSEGYFSYQRHLYSDEVFYFLTISSDSVAKRISYKPLQTSPSVTVNTYNDYRIHEIEQENLIKSGRQWFGERIDIQNNIDFDFIFSELDLSSPINVKAEVVARSLTASSCLVTINNSSNNEINIPQVSPSFSAEYAKIASANLNFLSDNSTINVKLNYSSADNSSMAWLNYIRVNARSNLAMNNNIIFFRDALSVSPVVGKFEIENAEQVSVWDITNPTNITQLYTNSISGNTSFNDSLVSLREYVAFNTSSYSSPNFIGYISNQNLRSLGSDIEYVIVSHKDFLESANRLANFHLTHNNLNTIVVDIEEIYHEFSSGMQDVTAVRDFARMLYKRPNSKFRYLLLFGDGSYDPKNRIVNNTNYIPTFQSFNSTNPTATYVTDDYYGLLDDNEGLFVNDLVDIGIGRFPVSTKYEADILVEKVENYYSSDSFGSWRNDILFVADDGDANDQNIHMWQSDSLSNIVDDNYKNININKIYLDSYYQESSPAGPRSQTAQDAITNRINKGVLLVNYTGHGSPLGWAQERILEVDQINNFENQFLPLFMTATCKFSYFDDPEKKSAGEYLLLNERGGAIALFSTTRLVYSSPNYTLNTNFINVLFEMENGVYPTIGDIFRKTKNASGSGMNTRNFTLLGDPALRLAYPKNKIQTSSINDTIKALSEITIYGYVEGDMGMLSSFNGTVFVTVYDKEIVRTTLGQESSTPMPYREQNNIIYKGTASVSGGEFSISFIVPKDIDYEYGAGRVSYYAISDDGSTDASGNCESFIIGGISNNINVDYTGPEIELYLNNRKFEDGGISSSSPILLVDIFDASGINMVGNGIGHDIIAILDDNNTSPYVLNDYYEANENDYTRGSVSFPFNDLEDGEHKITFKIWDVFNNSSEKTINFIVANENYFLISDHQCFPNPFVNSTNIYFQHNQSNQNIDVFLEIFSMDGLLVKSTSYNLFSNGFVSGPINWDGTNNYGQKLKQGMYFAHLYVKSEDKKVAKKVIRLILLSS